MGWIRTTSLLLTVLAWSATQMPNAKAAATIRRCTSAAGVSVYTDKACDQLQAQPRIGASSRRLSSPGDGRAALGAHTGWHCPQRLSQLVDEIQLAIQAADINRLSALYWWGGMGNAQASRLLERLETMASRPLVDIAPIYPAAAAREPEPLPGWIEVHPTDRPASEAGANPQSDTRQEHPDNESYPDSAYQPPARPRPYALRIEQILGNSGTPAREVLHLRRQYGCFWVSF